MHGDDQLVARRDAAGDTGNEPNSGGRSALPRFSNPRLLWFLLPGVLLCLLGPTACTVRSRQPILGPDSTMVYPSRIANDVNASITFALRDSRNRDAEKQRDKDRLKAISRLKKDREKLLDLQQAQEKESARRAKLAAEKAKKAAERAAEKAKKSKKSKKSSKGDSTSKADETKKKNEAPNSDAATSRSDSADDSAGGKPKANLFALSPASIQDSLRSIDDQLRSLMAEESLAQSARWKLRKAQGLPEDERAFDLEEDARVLATVRLTNVFARGKRPLTFHLVWLNGQQKRVFKKIYEYTPNDSTQVLTGSFSIPPSRRTPGFYTLQVFLQRELIATKTLELRGSGTEVPEGGGDDAM